MAIVSVLVYVFKTYLVYQLGSPRTSFAPHVTTDLLSAVSLFYKDISILLNPGLYSVVGGFQGMGIPDAISLLLFTALAVLAIKNALTDKKGRLFYCIFLISGITMFAMWLVSNYAVDMSSTRYLTFTAITVFMVIAMAYRPNDKAFHALVIALLTVSAFFTIVQMGDSSIPNADEYGLISFLKENNPDVRLWQLLESERHHLSVGRRCDREARAVLHG